MSAVLWLDEVGERDLPRVGRKAYALARLRQAGLPVPDGFVLLPGAPGEEATHEALRDAYRRLGGRVAVRSSSTAEDTAGASFAGQYRTVLDVTGEDAVMDAAAVCFASAEGAGAYAAAVGVETGVMAVLVQRFVEPRAAGVVFTRHPKDTAALVVESHAGRGEALVSGRVRPDRYVVDRASGRLREGPTAASLDAGSVHAVAALARRVEESLGHPVDVEWALETGGPVLLQARPLTVDPAEGSDPRVGRLTRANVGEVLPGPVTPLTWTTLGAFLEHAFHFVTAEVGLLPPAPPPFLVLHRQRLYLNLSLCLEVAARLPGVSSSQAERLFLGEGATGSGLGARGSGLAFGILRLPRVAAGLVRLASRLSRAVDAAEADVAALAGGDDLSRDPDSRLAERLEGWAALGRDVAVTHVATSGASAFRLALLARLLGRLAAGDPVERVNRLVGGLEDVASAAPTLALEALAREASHRPEWRRALDRPPDELTRALRAGELPQELRAGVQGFLDRFGHRTLAEGELRASTWRDDPAPVFAALGTLRRLPHAAGFRSRARTEARRADEEALLSRLGPLRRGLLRWGLQGAQRWVRERERSKSAAVAMVDHGRRLAREAARRLAAGGRLRHEDEVYFLTLEELVAVLRGRPVPAAALARRRRRLEREGALPAPREVDWSAAEPVAGAEPGGELRGTGVSAGVGLGPARVAAEGELPVLAPGEVLVAPVLDAGLGPALAVAAGAVVEVGGMLSHGSVVARELGVPCVVDVREATRRIRTGDRVQVDGGSGRVVVVGPGDQEPGAGASGTLAPAAEEDEAFHALEAHPLARESVYVNAHDPEAGIAVVASLGVRRGSRGEALTAVSLPDGRVLFGLDLGPIRQDARDVAVGGARYMWSPEISIGFEGRLSSHERADFPPAPAALLLAPRTTEVSLRLTLAPTTPAVDYCQDLPPQVLERLAPLGRHHVEQSGAWRGALTVDGRRLELSATGSRDHSWGRRRWEAADHWRLFTVRFGDDLAVHALSLVTLGYAVEGGFVWREGRAERITRVEYAFSRAGEGIRSLELSLATAAGPPLHLRGVVRRTVTVPVQLERRVTRHLSARPYRLLLHENYTEYEAAGRVGHGMAEVTERPL